MYLIKIGLFHRIKEVFKSYQIWYGLSVLCVQCKTKKFCHSLSRKQVRISIENIVLLDYSNFKNMEILSDQGVVQSGPNGYPRLPVLSKL